MKNYLFKSFTLALLSVFLLTACSKKNKTKPEDASGVGTITAELIFGSGEKVPFSYKHEKAMLSPVVLVGPDENGLYGLLMSGGQTEKEKDYTLMFSGFITKGKGTYHPGEEGDDVPKAAIILTVTDEEGTGGKSYFPNPKGGFNYTFVVTELTDHTIKGTFSGKLTTLSGSSESVTIKNGKFHFNKIMIKSED